MPQLHLRPLEMSRNPLAAFPNKRHLLGELVQWARDGSKVSDKVPVI